MLKQSQVHTVGVAYDVVGRVDHVQLVTSAERPSA
jgi:hypothetical protein